MATLAQSMPESEAGDAIEEIQDATRLRFLLMRLRDEHVWLNIRIKGVPTPFRSILIDIDLKRGRVILDELMPREVPSRLARGNPMRISANLDGGQLLFDTSFDEVVNTSDAPAYCCPVPDQISYWQRRREHRSVVGFGATIPVQLAGQGSTDIHGRLFDISSSGLSVTVENNVTAHMAVDTDGTQARIELPNGESLEAPVDLLYVQHDGTETPVRIGGRFRSLSPEQQRKIIRFVMACEREAARRHTAVGRR